MVTMGDTDANVVFAGDSEMARRCRALDWAATLVPEVHALPRPTSETAGPS